MPDDVSNEVLQSPQVASTNDEAEAIQVLGAVLKYDNVRLRLNPSLMHYDVQRSPAVSDLVMSSDTGTVCVMQAMRCVYI